MALRFSLGTLLAFLAMIAVPPQHLANADDLPSADDTAINIPRPDEHELVKDLAHLLNEPDEQQIKQITARLVSDKSIPIVVVTIESMKVLVSSEFCPVPDLPSPPTALLSGSGCGRADTTASDDINARGKVRCITIP